MMKKITLLLILLTVSLGYSQTFPLDFSNAGDAFTWDPAGAGGGDAIINTTSEKLEIFGNGNDWDNAFIAFTGGNVVDLSNNAANTITFTMQSTTAPVGEVHTHRIKLTGTGGVFETDWTTTGQEVKTVFVNPPALGNLTELRIFVDRQSSAGGTYLIDDIQLFVDSAPPTGFTATVGTIGAYSVELLLNATDDSGNVTYNVTDGATATKTAVNGSTTLVITGLTPETMYSFNVSASDGAGNLAANNPIVVGATTIADTNTPCEGVSSDSQQGTFANGGYSYKFETLVNGDVRMTFVLLESGATGVVARAWKETPFTESAPLTITGGNSASYDVTGLTTGAVISYAIKFEWASGGFGVTKYFSYTVGDNCATASTKDFEIAGLNAYPNPSKNSWTVKTSNIKMSTIKVYDILGKNVLSLTPNATEAAINGSSLKAGLYFAQIKTAGGVSSIKLVKE